METIRFLFNKQHLLSYLYASQRSCILDNPYFGNWLRFIKCLSHIDSTGSNNVANLGLKPTRPRTMLALAPDQQDPTIKVTFCSLSKTHIYILRSNRIQCWAPLIQTTWHHCISWEVCLLWLLQVTAPTGT